MTRLLSANPFLIGAALLTCLSCNSAGPTRAGRLVERPIDRLHRDFLDHSSAARILVVAHRGRWERAPENSLEAIELAIQSGADIVEIDIRRTADGRLVLMHDPTVDRMTNGTGYVEKMTFSQIGSLQLRASRGGPTARLTVERVPSLEQALMLVKSRAMLNLDKAWAYREDIHKTLLEFNMLNHAIFKSSAPPAEVAEFLSRDSRLLYCHVVTDANAAVAIGWAGQVPQVFEVVFDRLDDAQIDSAAIAAMKRTSRIWINTMWEGLAAGYTDDVALTDPEAAWGPLIELGANVIQTDRPRELHEWLICRDHSQVCRELIDEGSKEHESVRRIARNGPTVPAPARLTNSCTGRQPRVHCAPRTSVHRPAVGAGEL